MMTRTQKEIVALAKAAVEERKEISWEMAASGYRGRAMTMYLYAVRPERMIRMLDRKSKGGKK